MKANGLKELIMAATCNLISAFHLPLSFGTYAIIVAGVMMLVMAHESVRPYMILAVNSGVITGRGSWEKTQRVNL